MFILFPLVMIAIITAYIKDKPTDIYAVTNLKGLVLIQYQHRYPVKSGRDVGETYEMSSNWIPLTGDMKMVPGVTIKTEINSSVDLLLDDGLAFRIKEASLLKIDEDLKSKSLIKTTLMQGKILANLIVSKLRRLNIAAAYKLRIDTETAVCGIRRTAFSVSHSPDAHITKVAVLEGAASVFSAGDFIERITELGSGLNVPGGKKVEVTRMAIYPVLQDITSEEEKELLETKELKIETSIFERADQLIDFNIIKPLYDRLLIQIARYGMNNIVEAFINKSQFTGALPDSLSDIELATGNYQDPWGTDYLYGKINQRKAILISAGRDKIFSTADDLYKYINL